MIEKVKTKPLTQPIYNIVFQEPVNSIKYLVLQEDIAHGQRVESFRILAGTPSGHQYPIYQGTTIGNKKICQLHNPFEEQNPLLDDTQAMISRIQIQVTSGRDEVLLKEIKVY